MRQGLARIVSLYTKQKLSGVEIADLMGLPVRQVYRALDRQGIRRREVHESNALRFLRKPPSFTVRSRRSGADKFLWLAGVILYWAEGSHLATANAVDFANSNPAMVEIFLKFLRRICGVREERLRMYLYCYANQNVAELIRFWSLLTAIPTAQFSKPYVRSDFRQDKIGKMPYGLAHVRYSDKKLYLQLAAWEKEVAQNFWVGRPVGGGSGL